MGQEDCSTWVFDEKPFKALKPEPSGQNFGRKGRSGLKDSQRHVPASALLLDQYTFQGTLLHRAHGMIHVEGHQLFYGMSLGAQRQQHRGVTAAGKADRECLLRKEVKLLPLLLQVPQQLWCG